MTTPNPRADLFHQMTRNHLTMTEERANELINAYSTAVLDEAAQWLDYIGEHESAHQIRVMARQEL